MNAVRTQIATLAVLLGLALPGRAILFYATGDPAYNTNAPGGTLTNSGWQYTGRWGGFLGTVIGSRYFITAKHIGAQVGDPFHYQGVAYTTVAFHDDPTSDLRIGRVCGAFPAPFAPLYTNFNETSKSLVVMGRGTGRGSEVRINGQLKGWLWGDADGILRWGENRVVGPVPVGVTNLLQINFDATGGSNEAHLSLGDSGGPVFIREGTPWKLAGINYAVEGPYNSTNSGPGFNAAIFDEGGLHTYSQSTEMWVFNPDLPGNVPGAFYATRISTRAAWINSILNQSVPPDPPPVLQSASAVDAVYAEEPGAMIDGASRTITVPPSGSQRFYRLSACGPYRITGISFSGPNVVLTYE